MIPEKVARKGIVDEEDKAAKWQMHGEAFGRVCIAEDVKKGDVGEWQRYNSTWAVGNAGHTLNSAYSGDNPSIPFLICKLQNAKMSNANFLKSRRCIAD